MDEKFNILKIWVSDDYAEQAAIKDKIILGDALETPIRVRFYLYAKSKEEVIRYVTDESNLEKARYIIFMLKEGHNPQTIEIEYP